MRPIWRLAAARDTRIPTKHACVAHIGLDMNVHVRKLR
jgi:hypothetical protein